MACTVSDQNYLILCVNIDSFTRPIDFLCMEVIRYTEKTA